MKISVIVPVYNAEKYLDQCIASITAQTHSDLEIILIDDGATDRSPAICDQWAAKDSRITVIHQENGGEGAARNAGLDIATGTWVAFIDSDDYMQETYISGLAALCHDTEMVVCGFQRVYSQSPAEAFIPEPRHFHHVSTADLILTHHFDWIGFVAGKLYHLATIQKHHIRFTRVKLKADQLFFFQYLSVITHITVGTNHDYMYRQVEGSMSHMKFDFHTKLSRCMDFYHAVMDAQQIDPTTKALLLRNSLDGPIGILYSTHNTMKQRLSCLKSIDKVAYKQTKVITSWKEYLLMTLLTHNILYPYDYLMRYLFAKMKIEK